MFVIYFILFILQGGSIIFRNCPFIREIITPRETSPPSAFIALGDGDFLFIRDGDFVRELFLRSGNIIILLSTEKKNIYEKLLSRNSKTLKERRGGPAIYTVIVYIYI